MKQRFVITWVALAIVFIMSAVLASLQPGASELPFSSYSTSGEGTKAAYLLLAELGFKVERKTVSIDKWNSGGFVIALGADYLAEAGQDLTVPNSELFTNKLIRQNANDFIVMVFPHKDNTIVFDEYGRGPYPLKYADGFTDVKPGSLWDIMPAYLRFVFLYLCFFAFCVMFFYKQRVGEAISPEGFSGRNPMEGVNAMAAAMLSARVFKDSLEFYYKYQIDKNNEWDPDGCIGNSVKSVKTEREALALISEIDKRVNSGQ